MGCTQTRHANHLIRAKGLHDQANPNVALRMQPPQTSVTVIVWPLSSPWSNVCTAFFASLLLVKVTKAVPRCKVHSTNLPVSSLDKKKPLSVRLRLTFCRPRLLHPLQPQETLPLLDATRPFCPRFGRAALPREVYAGDVVPKVCRAVISGGDGALVGAPGGPDRTGCNLGGCNHYSPSQAPRLQPTRLQPIRALTGPSVATSEVATAPVPRRPQGCNLRVL